MGLNIDGVATPQVSQQSQVQTSNDTFIEPVKVAESEDDGQELMNEAIKLAPIKREFGIDLMDTEHDKKFRDILEWAKLTGIKNRNELFGKLRKISYQIGLVDGRVARIDKIHQWIRYDKAMNELSYKMEALKYDR
jgi:hypothetical protein